MYHPTRNVGRDKDKSMRAARLHSPTSLRFCYFFWRLRYSFRTQASCSLLLDVRWFPNTSIMDDIVFCTEKRSNSMKEKRNISYYKNRCHTLILTHFSPAVTREPNNHRVREKIQKEMGRGDSFLRIEEGGTECFFLGVEGTGTAQHHSSLTLSKNGIIYPSSYHRRGGACETKITSAPLLQAALQTSNSSLITIKRRSTFMTSSPFFGHLESQNSR